MMGVERARELRKNMTDTERFVWSKLRYRQLGGHRFRRQVPMGPYILDFVCLERRLIVELDGGQHAEQVEPDQVRSRFFEAQGYTVLRFWNHEALKDWEAVERVIWQHLQG
jgi:very-short-patch-repair endonuclease